MFDILKYSFNFLTPIFYKIVYMSIIASIIFCIILLIDKLFKNKISPKVKNIVWLLFFISLIVPMNINNDFSLVPRNLLKIQDITYYNEYINSLKDYEDTKNNLSFYNYYEIDSNLELKENKLKIAKAKYIIFDYILPFIYFFIFLLLLVIYIISYVVFRKKIGKKVCKDKKLINILEKCKEYLNIKKDVVLIDQDFVKSPSIFGIFKPKILINKNILELSDTKIRDIFLHELSHFKRKDTVLNPLVSILSTVYFFNPVILLAFKFFKQDIEIATDENVVINLYDDEKKDYCKTLLEQSFDKPNLTVSNVLSVSSNYSKSVLKKRITLIKISDTLQENIKLHTFMIVFLIVILFLLFLTVKPKTDLQIEREFSEIPKDSVKIDYPNIEVISNVIITENTLQQLSIIANNLLSSYFYNFTLDNTEPNKKISNSAMLKDDILAGDLNEFVVKVKYSIRSDFPKKHGISFWGIQGADNKIENEVMLRIKRLDEFEHELRKYGKYRIVQIGENLDYSDLKEIKKEYIDYSVFGE